MAQPPQAGDRFVRVRMPAPVMGEDRPVPRPFTHAVASFDPTTDAVLLWTRAPGEASLRWRVARDAQMTDVAVEGEVPVRADADHTAVVDATGLEAGTSWFYDFTTLTGARSPVGRTRTLPAGAERLRLGLVSCSRFSVAPLGVYRALAEREVDLVVHLGDYIYEDDGDKGVRVHEPPRRATTLADYRTRLAQVRADPDAQALHLRHPMVGVIDDHDIADNFWSTGAKAHDDDEDGPWPERARAALTARHEWLPQRLRDPGDPTVTWRSVPVGDLAELVLLDTRLAGRDQQAGDEGTLPLHHPQRSLLGDEQREWLGQRLADTSRPWAIVASGVVVNEVCLPFPAWSVLNSALPNGYAALDGSVLHDDQWDGYPAERRLLTDRLRSRGQHGGRTVLVSGDIHSSWAFEGPRGDDDHPVAVEVVIPSTSSKPMGRGKVPGLWRVLDAAVQRLHHVRWADVTRRGYAVLDLTPERATVEWWFVEPTDDDVAGTAWLGAAWCTERAPWPPAFEPTEGLPDPTRPDLPAPLPDRPADHPKLRRSHRWRVVGARGSAVAVPAVAALLLRRRRSARH
jgi:alkaline phosphatase D